MIADLKPYPSYKDAGLPWLDGLATGWRILRGKGVFSAVDIRSEAGKEELLTVSASDGVVPRRQKTVTMFMAKSYVGHKLCWPGDLVVNSLWAWMQGLGVAQHHGLVSSAYSVYRPRPEFTNYARFFHYLIRSAAYKWELQTRSKGVWLSRLQLSDIAFMDMSILLPPPDEQATIVRFLDHANRRLKRTIRAKWKVITLLNEQKQAIIHRAVTRGLDPNVPLKPSGIPWLGDISAHWEVRKLRNVAALIVSNVDKHSKANEEPVRLCNYTDVYKNEQITGDLNFMHATATKEEIRRFKIKLGDVIITKDSEEWDDIGVPALVAHEADNLVCGYHLAMVRSNQRMLRGEFLLRTLQDRFVATQVHVRAKGVTRYGLSHQAIKDMWLPIPRPQEQSLICVSVAQDLKQFDTAINRTEREIALLREYRTRLIADVVTGKLDVRAAAGNLPDESSEPEALIEADALAEGEDTADSDLDAAPEEAEA